MKIDVETARRILDFGARIGGGSQADEQLEGAVAIHNMLVQHKAAYLADEVGMGKTYVALGVLALLVVPFVVGAAVSFAAHTGGGEFSFVGLENFVSILSSRDFGLTEPESFYFTLGVTLLWTVLNVGLHLALGIALALLLREPWVRLRGLWRVLLIVPWAVPNYITALIWKGMFHRQLGAINAVLGWFGVEPVGWFDRFSTAFAANLATNVWLGFPFMMVISLGALQSIPSDLYEAARVDGTFSLQPASMWSGSRMSLSRTSSG